MSLEEYNCPEKVINIEEIQKIENIFRNAHLNTKSKIKITHTSVENRTYPYINYDLIIDKKIHINLRARKKTYVSEDKRIESRLTVTSSVYVEKSSNKKLHLNEYNQSLEIEIITWYSEFGKVLVNVEDILDANNKNIECYNEYKNKYLSTIKYNYAMHQPIYIRIINNRCFRYKYGNDSLEPFTGTIDNKNYIDGVLKG